MNDATRCTITTNNSDNANLGGYVRMHDLWGLFQQSFCPVRVQTNLNGHCVISRARIAHNAKDAYK